MEQTPARAIGATGNGTANCDLFPNLFTPIAIGSVTLKNRIFVTGHMTMMATDNLPNQDQVAYYEARARGGAALIVTEAAAVHATAVRSGSVIAATTDSCIAGYSHIVDICTPAGCIVFGQLFHPGREIKYAADGSLPVAYAPSATPSERFHVTPAPMTRGLIEDVIDGYGSAAERLQRAGVAGCEIVANMGYLPAQFLNPRVNRRQDDYGGSFENRLRFLRGVVSDIRLKTSRGFVVGLRICGDEMSCDGLNVDEVLEVCKVLANDDGLDYLNVIGGSSANVEGSIHIVPPMVVGNAYIAPYAACIKRETGMITLVAGRINQPHQAELAIAEGSADMCGMTRATICDPEMPNKARAGRPDDIRACIGCNQACIGHENMGHPISCIQHPETGRERRYGRRIPARQRRNIMVAGGGPGGMKAAAVAAERGHMVTLYEVSSQLGGQVRLAQLLPGRTEFGGIVTNLAREMELAGVNVVLNTLVDDDLVHIEQPDTVIVAAGAQPVDATGVVIEDTHVVNSWQVIQGAVNVGSAVVIADWRCDWVGLGIAEKLARAGHRVRLCVNGYVAGQAIQQYVRDHWVGVLHKLGVEVIPYVRLYGADSDTVYFQHIASGEPVVCEGMDTLVLALGHEREAKLAETLGASGVDFTAIGDCVAPRTAEEAVLEGLKAAHDL